MARHPIMLRLLWVGALVALFGAVPALAQCPLPDNLDGPPGSCCAPTSLILPTIPDVTDDCLDICWNLCDVDGVTGHSAEFTAPVPASTATIPPICSVYVTKLTLKDASGAVTWVGKLRMMYSRTWGEIDPTGIEHQVWRFLLNGDMKPQPAAGGSPCPVPPCASAFANRVRYTGYIDYAFNCSTGTWEFAWMLNHACDRIDHHPAYPRGGAFHPKRSYNFVGPAAGFVITSALPPEVGSTGFEAVRRIDLPYAGVVPICYFEEPIQSDLLLRLERCICGPATAPNQYAYSDLRITGTCGTLVLSTSMFPKGFLSKAIGAWTDPTVFPGEEELRWNMGGYEYGDCTGITRPEAFFGVTTMKGWIALQITSTLPPITLPLTFVDQSNAIKFPATTSTLNIAYLSDHVINLNFP